MKEKSSIFSTPEVQAIQEGRKTVMRPVVEPQPKYELKAHKNGWYEYSENPLADPICNSPWGMGRIPKYKVGDILWVRETFQAWGKWEELSNRRRHFVDMTNADHPYLFLVSLRHLRVV